MEGVAEEITDPSLLRRAMEAHEAKFGEAKDSALGPAFTVCPRVAFGFVGTPEEYAGSATRWRF